MDFPTEPGVYPGLTYAQYEAIPAIRGSDLVPYMVSPRRARWQKANPPSTDALRLGSAYHTAVLEPHRFDKDVAVLGPCCEILKSGQRKGKACSAAGKHLIGGKSYCGKHGNAEDADTSRTIVSEYELNRIISAKTALMQRTDIVEQLNQPHHNELTLVWKDDGTGQLCKARLDHKNNDGDRSIIELKTTSAAMLSAFHVEREVRKFGYDVKAAWQASGAHQLGIGTNHYLFVFIQTTQDCDVAAYWLHESSLGAGWTKSRRCLNDLIEARNSNHYPGIQPNGIGVIEVKDYDAKQDAIDDEGVEEAEAPNKPLF